MYRMDPSTFAYLVETLSPRIDKNFFQAERAGGYISPQLRVAMTIRWLAGGSYLDLKVNWGVATSTFYAITENVVDAIIATFPIEFDADEDALKARAAEFAVPAHRLVRGCFTAFPFNRCALFPNLSLQRHRRLAQAPATTINLV